MSSLLSDLRIGFRLLRQQPFQTALGVAALALGIGGVTAQFAVVDGVLLKGLPFDDAHELQSVERLNTRFPNAFNGGVPYPDFRDWSAQQTSFETFAGYLAGSTVNLTIDGSPNRFQGAYVTRDFLAVLAVRPVLGRGFSEEDLAPGAAPVVLLSHAAWEEHFGSRPDAVGKAVRLNGKSATVVGVMPEGFRFPQQEQVWVPITALFDPASETYENSQFGVNVLGRLRDGVSLDAVQVEMDSIVKRLAADHPQTNENFQATRIRPLADGLLGDQVRQILFIMLGSVIAVLLLACLNVANLQLARVSLRSKELAIRSALGASRLRLVRQVLTETLALAITGALVGCLLAAGLVALLDAALDRLPFPLPYWIDIRLDPADLGIVALATVVSAAIAGVLPALFASRPAVAEVLKETGRGMSSRLLGLLSRGIVVTQVAVACILLVVSGLFIRSILKQQQVEFGWDTGSVLSARLGLFEEAYPTNESRVLAARNIREAMLRNPAFSHAAVTSRIRMQFAGGAGPYEVDGESYPKPEDRPFSFRENVSAGFFETIAVAPREGRVFTELDDREDGPPVVVVNETFARKHFPGQSALGKRVRYANGPGPDQTSPWFEIVGVVPDLRIQGPFNNGNDGAGFYVPFAHDPGRFFTVLMRGGARPQSLTPAFMEALGTVDSDLPPYFVDTPENHVRENLAQNILVSRLFAAFGIVAVLLAAIGLYGVMAFSVGQRGREFGIRLALGSTANRLRGLILRQGSVQLAVGLVIGLSAAAGLVVAGRGVLQQFLFEVGLADPFTWLGVVGLLLAVSLASCAGPAIRAGRASALEALRGD